MPVAKMPYTYVVKNRYWRFRKGDLKAPLPGTPSDPAFHARYSELLALAQRVEAPTEVNRDTLSWLIKRYKVSAEFKSLRGPTQLDYERTLDLLEAEIGRLPYRMIERTVIKTLRDEHSATPRKAHKIKQMASRLYSWAQEEDLVDTNPAEKIKRLKIRAKAITPWSEEEIVLFLGHCPAELKTPFLLALYTGQRAEDVVSMEWSAYAGGFIRVTQSKTGEPLDIACHAKLRKHLAAIKSAFGGRIARTAKKRPYSANGFAQHIRRVIEKMNKDGIAFPDRSPHGLRYAAAARLEEAGVTPADATSILGHRTYQMAMKYLSQRKRSAAAIKQTGG